MLKRVISLFLIVGLISFCLLANAANVNRTVRVGCFPLNGFFEIGKDGKVTGYGADYTAAVAEHAGWNYTYVPFSSWVAALDALSKNEIDILAPSQHTAARDKLFAFDSFPIATEYGTLLALNKSNLIYEDYTSFNGVKVGCVDTLVFLEAYKDLEKRNNFHMNMTYYKDTPALLAALQSGEVEAIVANMMVKTDSMKLLARFGAAPVYYMLPLEETQLQNEMNQAIDQLTSVHPAFQKQLDNTYFSDFSNLPFSKQEVDYLGKAEELKVACLKDNAPYSYVDSATGKVNGIDVAVLERIAQISGLKFTYLPMDPKDDVEQFIKANDIDLVNETTSRKKNNLHGANFTESYLNLSSYFVGKKNTVFDSEKKMHVAMVGATQDQMAMMQSTYPNFVCKDYATMEEAIAGVRKGEEDMLVADRYKVERSLTVPANDDLQVLPVRPLGERMQFRVIYKKSSGNTETLTSILNKSLRQISEGEKDKMVSDYVQATKYKYGVGDFLYQYRFQTVLAALCALALAMGLSIVYKTKRKTQEAIEENELKLRHITNNISGGVIVLKADQGLNITYANDGFLELIDCTRQEFEASEGSYVTYVHPDDLHLLREAIASQQPEMSLELRIQKKTGDYIHVLFNGTAREKGPNEKELYCVVLDMTEQNRLLDQLRVDKTRTALILDRVEEVFYEVNLQNRTIVTSPSFGQKLGWDLPETFSAEDKNILASMWKTDKEGLEKLEAATRQMLLDKEPSDITIKIQSLVDNIAAWCEVSQYPILNKEEEIVTIIGVIKNIDEQVKERRKLMEQALRDQLTGLYHKEAFEQIVCRALEEFPDQNHALVFVDLDHFKDVNDTLGHLIGDKAICDAADKLKIIFSNYDVISRFGGDEFCIFVKNIPMETLRGKMSWLVDKLHEDYTEGSAHVHITCSSGVASTAECGYEYKALMQASDKALYAAKEQGRDRVVYASDMAQQD